MKRVLPRAATGLAFLVLTVALAAPIPARAQTFPTGPVRIVLPFATGGALDVMARAVAASMTATLGQSVFVESRPGGNSVIGTRAVARAAPDGHTILIQATAFLVVPAMMPSTPTYDPLKEFAPISNVSLVSQVLVVPPSSAAKTTAEFIALAKARPGALNYGSGGAGTSAHMAAELLMRQAGLQLVHVPYKGNAPALVDLLGGRLDLMFDNIPSLLQHIAAGRLRPLGVTSLKRSPLLTEVPAISETVPGYEASIFQGLFAPAGTPPAVLARLHAAVVRFTDDPANKERFAQQGTLLEGSVSPQAFATRLAADSEKWVGIVREAGIRAE
ncbi:MAG: tripartite tricarboxylate transporter substrate binding protein [Betaproteobacteria bacterium]|nr:tripartite tricarboxylate transporter substrate binding protein [Betaproteobacteria bacterium]